MKTLLKYLYNSHTVPATTFRFFLLLVDIAAIVFFIATAMMPYRGWIENIDLGIAIFFTLDLFARLWITPYKKGLSLASARHWIFLSF